jgi:hypothetical protein
MTTIKTIVFSFPGGRVTSRHHLLIPHSAQRTIAMTIHLINAAVLSVVTVFLVNRAFALYDLVNAATVSEHI